MIISLSGTPGSGKSTVAKLLAKKLGFDHYSMGDLRRKMAEERGMTLEQLNRLGEKEAFTDKEVDDYQIKLGKEKDNFVIDGRLSFHFIPHSIKVFLDVDLTEGARRVMDSNRGEESFTDLNKAVEGLKTRIASDKKRYLKYYDIDFFDKKHYDLVIDSTKISPQQVAEKIAEYIKKRK